MILERKSALVTGGTTGLGRAIAERFLGAGARAVITGRDANIGGEAEAELREHGEVHFVRADAADEAAITASVDRTIELLGGLDVLVNNAGIGVISTILETPATDFDRVMAVNLRGYYLYAKAAFPHLRERGGCMIHVSSDAGVLGEVDIGVYSVSKAAVIMLSNMLALECGRAGVRSNCICPGDIIPGMRHMAPPGEEGRQEDDPAEWNLPPIGRLGQARDVAEAALFLASDASSFCNGANLLVDGGMRAGYNADRPERPAGID